MRHRTSEGLLLVGAALLVLGAGRPVLAEEPPAEGGEGRGLTDDDQGMPARVVKLVFKGNRKVEDDAIKANFVTHVGDRFSPEHLREDVRAIWRMGFFEDIRVEVARAPGGLALIYRLREKPAIRKILVKGNDELGLDKINEVLDLKRDAILDQTKVKRNADKIKDLYIDKGYYLATVTSEVNRISDTEVDVLFVIDEHAKVEVRRIDFVGNRVATSAELRDVMQTQEGGYLSFLTSSGTYKQDAFDRDLMLITAWYYDHGYINVKLGKPQVSLSPDKRYMYITISVTEGPQYRIGKLDFRGELIGSREDHLKRLTVKPGETFNRSKLGQDILRMTDWYKDQGFAYVDITPLTSIDSDSRIVDLAFEVQKGQKVYFERINIRGNVKTRDKVIRRELKIAEGELFSQSRLDLSKRRVMMLGFFEKVDLSTKRGSSDEYVVVNLEVTERPTGTFQIGAGFSSVENFIAQAQISQNNLFGRGQTLALMAQLSSLRQLFSLRFIEPYFLDTPWTFAFNLYNTTLIYNYFERTAYGGDLTWGYALTDDVRLFLTYKLENVSVQTSGYGLLFGNYGGYQSPVQSARIANLFRAGITSSVRGSINWDTRNDRMFPSRGMFHNLSAEFADPATGSENTYTRYTWFSRFYHPIIGPFIFKLNLQAGFINSRQAQGVPIFERYFLGGIMDIRGFHLYSLGPRILVPNATDPNAPLIQYNVGGNLEAIMNAEIEFPIFEKVGIRGVVFFDAGNAFNTESRYCGREPGTPPPVMLDISQDPCVKFDIRALRTSVGFGFRWFSPIGPLRFEWGIPLKRLPGEDSIVFEFTIGNFF
jgi:outer membrane protein insertion porin family